MRVCMGVSGSQRNRRETMKSQATVAPAPSRDSSADIEEKCKACWRVKWVLDPRTVAFVAWWDLVATFALVFTALVTPYEVAFLVPPTPSERLNSPLFLMNRGIDIVFIVDILLQFRLAYKDESVHGTSWIVSPKQIAHHYMFSKWFPLDLFSTLTSLFDIVGGEGTEDLTALRAVRTLRLVKLVKLARGSRIFKRWEMRISINYDHLSLVTVMVGILLVCHWTACVWALQATFNPLGSWLGAKEYCVAWNEGTDALATDPTICPDDYTCTPLKCDNTGSCQGGYACVGGYDTYVYSLYFAIMTVRHFTISLSAFPWLTA
jgi:hypothetical protein